MRYSKINTLRILLLLPLVLLHLQSGIALLHHHHRNSWYDLKDPTHHISIVSITPAKWAAPSAVPVFPSYPTALPTVGLHVTGPNGLILGHVMPLPPVVAGFEPTASFPNRASPA